MGASWGSPLDQENAMALGDLIRALRKEAGLSQAELGNKIGTDGGASRPLRSRPNHALGRGPRAARRSVQRQTRPPAHRGHSPPVAAHHRNFLGDRLAAIAQLDDNELAILNGVIEGLIAKNRLRALAGGIS
jgi:hypothetical protein